jgi:hypothetical protein
MYVVIRNFPQKIVQYNLVFLGQLVFKSKIEYCWSVGSLLESVAKHTHPTSKCIEIIKTDY